MQDNPNMDNKRDLPAPVAEFVRQVVRKMGYRRRARQEVEAELMAHFEDELKGVVDVPERERKARRLIEQFGDVGMLAVLCRRAKKRCRPLWAQAMVRTAQAVGVLLILFVLYTAWFVAGRPAPTVNYVAVLNRMSRPEIAERDDAWPHYERAIALLVEPDDDLKYTDAFTKRHRLEYPGWAALPQEARSAIEQWVRQNDAAWQEFVAASTKPYCQKDYACDPNTKEPWLLSILLLHLKPMRDIGALGLWRSRLELGRGDTPQALDDCLAIARAARHWQTREFPVQQLVGIALSRIAHEEILGIVQERDLPPDLLADLQHRVADLYSGQYPLIEIEGERIFMLDTIQRVFTNGGPGGGHLAPAALRGFVSKENFLLGTAAAVPILTAMGMVHAGRNDTVAKANWLFDQQVNRTGLSPYERRTADIIGFDQMLDSLPTYRYPLIYLLVPARDRAADLAFRGRALHEATLTVLALQRYRAEKGGYPASLETLTGAGYLNALPADPYSAGPLAYKAANDGFMLYSVGPNFDDEGGVPGTNKKGRFSRWAEHAGDVIFWPVREQ